MRGEVSASPTIVGIGISVAVGIEVTDPLVLLANRD
jgi:hypothetical protein